MNEEVHQHLPLTPATAKRLILEAFSGKTATRPEIVTGVVQLHRSRGGDVEGSSNPTATIKKHCNC
jgi:hypothetical protein